ARKPFAPGAGRSAAPNTPSVRMSGPPGRSFSRCSSGRLVREFLDRALNIATDAGELHAVAAVRALATRMLADDRADRVEGRHAVTRLEVQEQGVARLQIGVFDLQAGSARADLEGLALPDFFIVVHDDRGAVAGASM